MRVNIKQRKIIEESADKISGIRNPWINFFSVSLKIVYI